MELRKMRRLLESWTVAGSQVQAVGDADEINRILLNSERIGEADDGWRVLYQEQPAGIVWELSFPQSEMHGGGPRQLLELNIETAKKWA